VDGAFVSRNMEMFMGMALQYGELAGWLVGGLVGGYGLFESGLHSVCIVLALVADLIPLSVAWL